VFVLPAFRGRGHASALIRRTEAFAHAASVPTARFHTATAEAVYAHLGWQRVGIEQDSGQPVVLMTCSLSQTQHSNKRAG
jgi:GNAT superfamily N-acetyltransferase